MPQVFCLENGRVFQPCVPELDAEFRQIPISVKEVSATVPTER